MLHNCVMVTTICLFWTCGKWSIKRNCYEISHGSFSKTSIYDNNMTPISVKPSHLFSLPTWHVRDRAHPSTHWVTGREIRWTRHQSQPNMPANTVTLPFTPAVVLFLSQPTGYSWMGRLLDVPSVRQHHKPVSHTIVFVVKHCVSKSTIDCFQDTGHGFTFGIRTWFLFSDHV